jgi:hypothetical protein
MSALKTINLLLNKWAGTDNVKRDEFIENFDILDREVGQQNYKKVKSAKDVNKLFATEIWYLKGTTTKFREFTLSGGATPLYTTLTMKEYAADGITILVTKTWTLAYDGDGDLLSTIPN